MRRWSIPVLDLFGIHFRIHFSYPLMFCLVWYLEHDRGPHVATRSFLLLLAVFVAVLAHELAHAAAAARNGIRVRTVVLLPITGVSLLDEQAARGLDARREIRLALAGPVINILLALFLGCSILLLAPRTILFSLPLLTPFNLLRSMAWSQLLVGVVNLLPAYPLDGGRILRALLARSGDQITATRRAVAVGQYISLALFIVGAGVSLGHTANNLWVMMAGVFMFLAAKIEDRSLILQAVLERVRVNEVMTTEFRTLSPADTLADALQRAVEPPQEDFPVVRGTEMVGIISRQQMAASMQQEGNGYVQSAMLRNYTVASPQESLAAVLRRISHGGLAMIPVVEGDYLIGIITFQNLMRKLTALSLHRAEPKPPQQQASA